MSSDRELSGALEAKGREEGLERKFLGRKCRQGVTKDARRRRNECRNETSKEMGKRRELKGLSLGREKL